MAQIKGKGALLKLGAVAAGSAVGGAGIQAIMDRSGSDAKVVTRNGLLASLGGAIIGGVVAVFTPKSKVLQDAGLALASASMGAASSIGVQHLDVHLEAKSTQLTQEQQDQLRAMAAGDAPALLPARAASVDLLQYADA